MAGRVRHDDDEPDDDDVPRLRAQHQRQHDDHVDVELVVDFLVDLYDLLDLLDDDPGDDDVIAEQFLDGALDDVYLDYLDDRAHDTDDDQAATAAATDDDDAVDVDDRAADDTDVAADRMNTGGDER